MRRRRRQMPARGKLLLFIIFFFLFILLFNSQVKPVIESITANEAKIKSVGTINEAVMDELGREGVSYGDLISVDRGADGNVLSITTNMIRMNELKAKMISNIQAKLGDDTYATVGVPLGTLISSTAAARTSRFR